VTKCCYPSNFTVT